MLRVCLDLTCNEIECRQHWSMNALTLFVCVAKGTQYQLLEMVWRLEWTLLISLNSTLIQKIFKRNSFRIRVPLNITYLVSEKNVLIVILHHTVVLSKANQLQLFDSSKKVHWDPFTLNFVVKRKRPYI